MILALSVLSSCAAPRTLPPGTYLETTSTAVIFSSKELQLYPGRKFRFIQYSDDLSSTRYGSGAYRLRGARLDLRFDGRARTDSSRATLVPLPAGADSARLRFDVSFQERAQWTEPLPGATISVQDAAGQPIATFSTRADGVAYLPVKLPRAPYAIKVSSIGLLPCTLIWPAKGVSVQVVLRPQLGTVFPSGLRKQFRLLSQSSKQLTLLQAPQDTLILVAQP